MIRGDALQAIDVVELASQIDRRFGGRKRIIIAVAGPPGSGKSTLVEELVSRLMRFTGRNNCTSVPLDGFHYDNAVLDALGRRYRKGAPCTFDVWGYRAALQRIGMHRERVAVPLFDRSQDLSRAGARIIEMHHRLVLTEGNYLLLDEAPWRGLAEWFDLSIMIDAPDAILEQRLIQRWIEQGYNRAGATHRVRSNDMLNVEVVRVRSRAADFVMRLKK